MSDPPKLSDAVVERLARHRAKRDNALHYYEGEVVNEDGSPAVNAVWQCRNDEAREDLTAALRLDDPETVERLAFAIFCQWGVGSAQDKVDSWARRNVDRREQWLEQARAAITALLADPEEQP